MKFNLFKRKKKVEPVKMALTPTKWACDYCHQNIYQEQGYTKNQAGVYHRYCWKEMVRASKA